MLETICGLGHPKQIELMLTVSVGAYLLTPQNRGPSHSTGGQAASSRAGERDLWQIR